MAWTDPPVGSIRAMRFVIQAICVMRSGMAFPARAMSSIVARLYAVCPKAVLAAAPVLIWEALLHNYR
jgi:hypothetical protein